MDRYTVEVRVGTSAFAAAMDRMKRSIEDMQDAMILGSYRAVYDGRAIEADYRVLTDETADQQAAGQAAVSDADRPALLQLPAPIDPE